jgi:predicted DNA-binding transcriptional regulator YafY
MSLLERVYFFHNELTRNCYPNARTLMREFEISQPTARRDIAYLRDRLLAPLAYDQHKNGFYYEDQSFNLPFVNNSRIVFLLGMLSRIAEETGLKDLPEIRQLEQRLATMTGQDYGRLQDIIHCEWIEVEHPEPHIFDTIIDAIVTQHQLNITYQSPRKETTTRILEPLKLINYQGRWYLLAWCTLRQATRTFHLARIKSPTIGAKISQSRKAIAEHLGNSFGIFKGTPCYHAEILFTGTAAELVKNQIWHKDQIVRETGQGVLFRLPVRDDREIVMKVLQYGGLAQVLSPTSLIKTIINHAKSIISTYR